MRDIIREHVTNDDPRLRYLPDVMTNLAGAFDYAINIRARNR